MAELEDKGHTVKSIGCVRGRFPAIFCLGLICLSFRIFGALPDVPEDQPGAEAWMVARKATIAEQASMPSDESIPALGEMVRQLYDLNYRDSPELSEVRAYAVERLLAIPGHARFYDRQIKDARERLNAENDPYERSPLIGKFQAVKANAFTILAYLPSRETVAVLGELLFDDSERVPSLPGETKHEWTSRQNQTGMSPSSSFAVGALARLPLVAKPVQRTDPAIAGFVNHPEDLEPWRLWFEQVRAGNRNFRFEGDPREYNLKGPVDQLEPATNPAERQTTAVGKDPANQLGGDKGASSSRPMLVVVLGALALCGVATWRAFRKRDHAGP